MQREQTTTTTTNRGFLIALISAFILAFTGILIRLVSEDYQVPALVIAFWRDLFVVVCALPFLLASKSRLLRIEKKHLPFLITFGFVLAVFNISWTLAVTLTGAAVATVLVYSSAAFTAVLGWFLLKERLGTQKIFAVVLCLCGCTLVSGAVNAESWQTNPRGIITGLLSGLLYAFYSLLGRRGSQKGLNPWTILFYSFLFAAIILLSINLMPIEFLPGTASKAADLLILQTNWRGWLLLLILAAGPTLLGFGLYNISLGMLPSSTANLILTVEPVLTTIIAFFLLGERLSLLEIIGSGFVIVALLLLRLRATKNASASHANG